MAGVMMFPAVAPLGWTMHERASEPVPPPPPPPIAIPPLLVSRRSYGQATVRSAATAIVTPQSLLLISNPPHPTLSDDCKTRRKMQGRGPPLCPPPRPRRPPDSRPDPRSRHFQPVPRHRA